MMDNEKNTVSEPSAKYQYISALVASLISIGYGINCGFAGPTITLLESDESPLPTGKITKEEESWIVALFMVGCLVGNTSLGFAIKKFGRKWPLFYVSFPMIISWMLIFSAQDVYYLYLARILHGFVAGGVIVSVPVYLIEISNDRIRGTLSSSVSFCGNFGIMLVFITGNYYKVTPIIAIVLTLLYAILFYFLPETPIFLMTQNKVSEATKSIRFYQNMCDSKENREILNNEIERLSAIVGEMEDGHKHSFKWAELMNNLGRKAITIGVVLNVLNQFGGCFALLNYVGVIFKASASNVSVQTSTMIVGVIQFLGTCVLIFLVDRAGRRILYIFSTFGAFIGYLVLGSYMMMKSWQWDIETYNFIPLISFSVIIFSASCAILSLPFTVIGEVMPESIKDFGVTLCTALLSIFGFIVLKFLPDLTALIELHGCLFVFAGVCFLSAIFIIFYMPETKAKSYEEIMQSLH